MNWTITQISSVVLCAMGSGMLLSSLGHSPVIGYIIAGILLGPSGFQFISDREAVSLLSEMGVLFLLFVVGLNLSFERIKNIWKTSVVSTLISMAAIYICMLLIGTILKLSHVVILLMTFCFTLSSTAVTVKTLALLKEHDRSVEDNTFGILVAQDLLAIVMVLVISFMGKREQAFDGEMFSRLVSIFLFFIGLGLYFSRYQENIHRLTSFIERHGDMLSMVVFGICLGSAVLAELAGLSAPFGAFIAGLTLGNSRLGEKVKNIAYPIEEILLMTFFLSIGLLVDREFIWNNLGVLTLGLLFVSFGKTAINIFVFRLCHFPLKESFIISVLLAHTGEFAFMLAYAAFRVDLISAYGVKFLVSLTAASLFFSPMWLMFAERCRTLATSAEVGSSWEFFRLASGREIQRVALFFSRLWPNIKYWLGSVAESARRTIEQFRGRGE